MPLGTDKGKSTFVASYTAGNAWIYVAATGAIKANCAATEKDATGKLYTDY